MQKLLEHITGYMDYLTEECGLSVSVHFDPAAFSKLPLQAIDSLMPYNIHRNPYCIMVKTDAGRHHKCVREQHALYDRTDCNGFCRTCHAGVMEYVLPLSQEDRIIGIIAVSGYRMNDRSAAAAQEILHYDLWQTSLKAEEIPVRLCEILLPPLAAMLEKLLTFHAAPVESEYNMMIQYLHEYHTDITLEDFCSHFGRSRSYVSHMFKSTCGVGFRTYCNRLKLEDARKLLLQTDLSVTQIALDTGFNDVSYFISLFSNRYGCTPLQYRLHRFRNSSLDSGG